MRLCEDEAKVGGAQPPAEGHLEPPAAGGGRKGPPWSPRGGRCGTCQCPVAGVWPRLGANAGQLCGTAKRAAGHGGGASREPSPARTPWGRGPGDEGVTLGGCPGASRGHEVLPGARQGRAGVSEMPVVRDPEEGARAGRHWPGGWRRGPGMRGRPRSRGPPGPRRPRRTAAARSVRRPLCSSRPSPRRLWQRPGEAHAFRAMGGNKPSAPPDTAHYQPAPRRERRSAWLPAPETPHPVPGTTLGHGNLGSTEAPRGRVWGDPAPRLLCRREPFLLWKLARAPSPVCRRVVKTEGVNTSNALTVIVPRGSFQC